jgi:hypothetical protein
VLLLRPERRGHLLFFDGDSPFGVAAATAGANSGIEANDVAASYKPVSKEMLKASPKELHFEPGDVNADDGTTLPGFQISMPVKLSN